MQVTKGTKKIREVKLEKKDVKGDLTLFLEQIYFLFDCLDGLIPGLTHFNGKFYSLCFKRKHKNNIRRLNTE